jgi:hypothetical protein
LEHVIDNVKTKGLGKQFGPAMTVFILAQVGNDKKAKKYLEGLAKDEGLSSMIYALNQSIDKITKVLGKEVGDDKWENAYQTLVSVGSH